jgi:hypothetical protein
VHSAQLRYVQLCKRRAVLTAKLDAAEAAGGARHEPEPALPTVARLPDAGGAEQTSSSSGAVAAATVLLPRASLAAQEGLKAPVVPSCRPQHQANRRSADELAAGVAHSDPMANAATTAADLHGMGSPDSGDGPQHGVLGVEPDSRRSLAAMSSTADIPAFSEPARGTAGTTSGAVTVVAASSASMVPGCSGEVAAQGRAPAPMTPCSASPTQSASAAAGTAVARAAAARATAAAAHATTAVAGGASLGDVSGSLERVAAELAAIEAQLEVGF